MLQGSIDCHSGPVMYIEGPVMYIEGPVMYIEGPVMYIEGPVMYIERRELLPAESSGINDLSYPSESLCPS